MSLSFADVAFTADRKNGQKQPSEVLIRQREYKHDVAVLSMDFEGKVQDKYAHGAPVTIAYGWLPDDVEYFHGYVHHTEQKNAQQKLKRLDVYCVGASYRMKQIRLRSFKRLKAHQVAALIAREHHLSLTASCHEFTHEHLTQHGRSDWDFLVWLAKRCGLTFYANRTDVVFTRRVIDTSPSRQRPTFTLFPGRFHQRGAVYSIVHKVGENLPGTASKARVVAGVTAGGAHLKAQALGPVCDTGGTKVVHKPVFGKVTRTRPVHTVAHAQSLLDGEADLHRFNTLAHAEVSGNTQVHQGSTVRLTGLDEDSDGFWYVGMVDHMFKRTGYTMRLELGRDQLGDRTAPVVLSGSGKPVLIDGCEVGVTDRVTPPPASVYNPVDDCAPVETAVADLDDQSLPFNIDPARTRQAAKAGRSPARAAAAKPVPTHPRGCACCKKKPTRPVVKGKTVIPRGVAPIRKAKPHKLTGWRATHHVVRMQGPC